MLAGRTRLLWAALACGLSVALTVPAAAVGSAPPDSPPDSWSDASPGPVPPETGTQEHSSDETEPILLARRAGGAANASFTLHQQSRPVAPGLELIWFDRYDSRGWFRVSALTADLGTPGLRLDYTAPGKVSSPGPLSKALQRDRAVAGVNGDFFDISDTGAPLGVGVDRQRGLLHGSVSGWNRTFTLDRSGVASIARRFLEARIVRRSKPAIDVTDLNAPRLREDGIGIYTSAWGADSRSRVLPHGGARREVVVRGGRVKAKRKRLSSGPVPAGTIHLVGIGDGARTLSRLRVGQHVSVEYALDTPARVAVSGNKILLRNGRVLAPSDVEMHPRTAIGIDRDQGRLIIVAVDGRSSTSRGLTMRETAVLLKRLGAEDGLNLDGGGSSTMMARESGEDIQVVNDPSDGNLRSVPNGLAFTVRNGSGRLRGIRIEPVTEAPDQPGGSVRVLRGLTRRLVARGHDETLDPVPARPRWSGTAKLRARPGPGRRTVVVGRRPGFATVTASAGDATGTLRLRVLGTVHRLEASAPTLSLAGRGSRATVSVQGYDVRGFGTWVEPRDLRLDYDRRKLRVTRTRTGLTVTARVHSTSEVLRISAGGRSTAVGVAVGLARRPVDRMNTLEGWTATAYPAASEARVRRARNRHGRPRAALALRYTLTGKRSPRAAYLVAKPARTLPARTRRLGLWVRGDGKGAMLRMLLRDESGTRGTATLTEHVSWKGWRFLAAPVPDGLRGSLDLLRVYAVETRDKRRYSGLLAVDDLTAFVERVPPVPAGEPVRDAMVADREPLAGGGLRVAVVSGAGLSADAQRSAAVARTRRVLQEVAASGADVALVGGDLLRSGTAADMDFARRLLEDELGGEVPWRYLPGDGELDPDGDLDAFRAEFGHPVRVLDRAGTRIVLLNSAPGTLRLGGFQQLVRLRGTLNAAATDEQVHSVLVVAHHPTSDPAPGGSAELADAREGNLVETLLADFRERSGKPVAYLGSHARRFATSSHDGVWQVLAGPVNRPARRVSGSFTGWTMLRVGANPDPGPAGRLGVQFRPQVNRLEVRAPDRLPLGESAPATAVIRQRGRPVEVEYPMPAEWLATRRVHIGPARRAPDSAVLAYTPATDRLTALRPGTATVALRVSGVRADHRVTVE